LVDAASARTPGGGIPLLQGFVLSIFVFSLMNNVRGRALSLKKDSAEHSKV